jgi:hypothetical protein
MGKLSDLGKRYGHPSDVSQSSISSETEVELVGESPAIKDMDEFDRLKPMSWVNITKIVYEKDIYPIDLLSILYSSIHDTCKTMALLIRKEKFGEIRFYLGVRDNTEESNYVSKYILQKALKGLLPGVTFADTQIFLDDDMRNQYVSSVAGIPSLKNDKNSKFEQGIERLVNAAIDIPSYSLLLVADSLNENYLETKLASLEVKYSELSSEAELTSTTSKSNTSTNSESSTEGSNSSSSSSKNITTNISKTTSESNSETKSETVAFIVGKNGSESKSDSESTTKGSSESNGESTTSGLSNSKTTSSGNNNTEGISRQVKSENKTIKNQLKQIEKDIARLLSSKSCGLWNFNAFFIADNRLSVQALASLYKGLMIGKESQESVKVNTFDAEASKKIIENIVNVSIPIQYKSEVSLNSEELAICMNFPQTSVPGILVCEQVAFGRNINYKADYQRDTVSLGCLHHLGIDDKQNALELDTNLLTSHLFVSGTTGSGKSNALYLLLSKIRGLGKKFMVIEPAKGEYKNVFGKYSDVSVYGVLPGTDDVLKINPFSFPPKIHVEEHIDRLIDIFNACWPMYAAMPSVLKAAVSNAYRSCGWNLITSESEYGIFPTFADVIRELTEYVNNSEYSSDSKGDYKGALQTRIEGLTYGIVGNVFNHGDIPSENLFDSNVIIDLSRVGSSETKALIMGLLILKLNEYRASSGVGANLNLQHITVLEEAHNLLKASSSVQNQESANIAGKSVEMIASAIAEMRTFGESFVIADQSPSMLDRSVIRNTNTKIIFALPDSEDRNIAASSFFLSEAQTGELSKLSTGIAAVYQKGWEEPILAHIDKYEDDSDIAIEPHVDKKSHVEYVCTNENLANIVYNGFTQLDKVYVSELSNTIMGANISGKAKYNLRYLIDNSELESDSYAKMMVYIVGVEPFMKAYKEKDIKVFDRIITDAVIKTIGKNIHLETLINAYVKGCSDMNTAPFYEAWLCSRTK